MTTFDPQKYAEFAARMIAEGAMDAQCDLLAKAITNRRLAIRSSTNPFPLAWTETRKALAKFTKFSVGDIAQVVHRGAPHKTYQLVGKVQKVNRETLWLVQLPDNECKVIETSGGSGNHPTYRLRWQYSSLTRFQQIKGFKVRIDHCEHLVGEPVNVA